MYYFVSEGANADDDHYEPPKVEVESVTEEDAFYTKRYESM